jgi:cytochrome c
MKFLKSSWVIILVAGVIAAIIIIQLLPHRRRPSLPFTESIFTGSASSTMPDTNNIPDDANGDLIRYGMQLVSNTALYLGPKGIVKAISNRIVTWMQV